MIIVTGATGFVGTYLVDRLVEDGNEVLAVGRSAAGINYYKNNNIPLAQLDITNEEDFEKLPKAGVDAVVHLAGLLSIDIHQPKDYFFVNTIGTRNILEYCRKNEVPKIVYSMTHSDVNRAEDKIITEKTPRKFAGSRGYARSYIISKIAAMNFVDNYAQEYGINGVNLRFPGIRGYGARFVSFWKGVPQISASHIFIQKAMHGDPIEVWGKNDVVRDLVYIKDVVSGIIAALKTRNAKGLYNIGSGVGLTIEDEVKGIIEAFSSRNNISKIIYRPDLDLIENRSYIFDITKANKELGYIPIYTYEDAMNDYKKEMKSQRFRHLILKQERILNRKHNLSLEQLISKKSK